VEHRPQGDQGPCSEDDWLQDPASPGSVTSVRVVFLHGMFMTHRCWDGWVERYTKLGVTCEAPPWPHHEASPPEIRAKHPDPKLGALTLPDVVEAMARVVSAGEKPVLIGHSMGGLIVQLLLARGLGVAGVGIDSAPPAGVVAFSWSFIKSNWGVINPFANVNEAFLPSPAQFKYAFAHTLPEAEVASIYEQQVTPESRRVGRGPLSGAAKIDFTQPRPPLLLVAGSDDHIVPTALNRANWHKQRRSPGGCEFREFPGRVHYILGQSGWEEVADFVLEWVKKHAG